MNACLLTVSARGRIEAEAKVWSQHSSRCQERFWLQGSRGDEEAAEYACAHASQMKVFVKHASSQPAREIGHTGTTEEYVLGDNHLKAIARVPYV